MEMFSIMKCRCLHPWGMWYLHKPKGSDSFGEEYADLRGKYGTIDYEDLMAFTDAVLQETHNWTAGAWCVAEAMEVFMTNWIITQTDRFQAAASSAVSQTGHRISVPEAIPLIPMR